MLQSTQQANFTSEQVPQQGGIWVIPAVYSVIMDISEEGLANKRFQQTHPEKFPNRKGPWPIWRAFGRSIRYFLPPGSYSLLEINAIRAKIAAERPKRGGGRRKVTPAGSAASSQPKSAA